jgi:predicted nucleic acid-binding protein
MAAYFFDSSAIVKRYVSETGTAWVISVVDPATGHRIYLARITGVEVVSAITRQGRGGSLSATDAATAITQFRHDFAQEYRLVEIMPLLVSRAMTLAEAYALRGYDAVQLAAALRVNAHRLARGMPALTFVSADAALNAAATAEGLTVEDPNAHP